MAAPDWERRSRRHDSLRFRLSRGAKRFRDLPCVLRKCCDAAGHRCPLGTIATRVAATAASGLQHVVVSCFVRRDSRHSNNVMVASELAQTVAEHWPVFRERAEASGGLLAHGMPRIRMVWDDGADIGQPRREVTASCNAVICLSRWRRGYTWWLDAKLFFHRRRGRHGWMRGTNAPRR